jgi:hypothetical protein
MIETINQLTSSHKTVVAFGAFPYFAFRTLICELEK